MNFYISATTDVGIKRKVNQDSLMVRHLNTKTGPMVLAVMCDGMGGLKHGEVASATVIAAFSDWMYTYLPMLSQKPIEDHVIREQWTKLVTDQNQKIRAYGQENGCATGSTVSAILLTGQRYYVMNVGDSRVYELTDDTVRQITEDHTVIANEIRLGNLTPEQAEASPARSMLTRCVGVAPTVQPDMFYGPVQKGASYMLCSDGFRHCITPEEIREHLLTKVKQDPSAIKQQEEMLVEYNKQRGETDNISVITIYAE